MHHHGRRNRASVLAIQPESLTQTISRLFGTGQTLLQQTYERYKQILPAENIFITTNQHYRELVLNSLPGFSESNLIVEEEHRNTAPAIAYASYVIQKINPDGSIVVAPSDHLILKMDEFKQDILKSLEFASHSDKLLTLGIKPSYPETGYGYIQVSEEKKKIFTKSRHSSRSRYGSLPRYLYKAMSSTGIPASLYGTSKR